MGRIVVDLAGYKFYKVNPTSGTPFYPIHTGAARLENFGGSTVELRALDVCASGYAVKFQLGINAAGSGTTYGAFIAVPAGQSYSVPAGGVKSVRLMNLNADGSHDAIYQVIGWY